MDSAHHSIAGPRALLDAGACRGRPVHAAVDRSTLAHFPTRQSAQTTPSGVQPAAELARTSIEKTEDAVSPGFTNRRPRPVPSAFVGAAMGSKQISASPAGA